MSYPFIYGNPSAAYPTGPYAGFGFGGENGGPTYYGPSGGFVSPYYVDRGNYGTIGFDPYLGTVLNPLHSFYSYDDPAIVTIGGVRQLVPECPAGLFSLYTGYNINAIYNNFGHFDPAVVADINSRFANVPRAQGFVRPRYVSRPKVMRGNTVGHTRFARPRGGKS